MNKVIDDAKLSMVVACDLCRRKAFNKEEWYEGSNDCFHDIASSDSCVGHWRCAEYVCEYDEGGNWLQKNMFSVVSRTP